ncbi:hypothetical protein ACOMHN_042503 [Nucella lapillus]
MTTYEEHLERFQKCKSFDELKSTCQTVSLENFSGTSRCVLDEGFDVPGSGVRYPVKVIADGDCMCWRWTQKKKHPKFLSPVNPTHLGYRKSLRKNPANLGYKKSLLKNPANLGCKKSLLMDPTNLRYQKSFLKNPANLGYNKSLLKNPANLGYQKSLRKNPANLGYQKSLRKYSFLTEVPPTKDCLGKYVVVVYNKVPYPGYVEDTCDCDVYR